MSVDTVASAEEFCSELVAEASADRRAMTKHPFIESIASGLLRDGVWSHMELRWQAYMEPLLSFAD